MVANAKPQQRKKGESERLRGERDQVKLIDLRFERWQVVRFRKVCLSRGVTSPFDVTISHDSCAWNYLEDSRCSE